MNFEVLDLDDPSVVKFRYMEPRRQESRDIHDSNWTMSQESLLRANLACIQLEKNEMYVLLRGPLGICPNKRILGGKFDQPFATYDKDNKQMNLILNKNYQIQDEIQQRLNQE